MIEVERRQALRSSDPIPVSDSLREIGLGAFDFHRFEWAPSPSLTSHHLEIENPAEKIAPFKQARHVRRLTTTLVREIRRTLGAVGKEILRFTSNKVPL